MVKVIFFRLIEENGEFNLYYSCENSNEYHEYELQFLEVDLEFVPAIKKLIKKYPKYIKVADLPLTELDKKVNKNLILCCFILLFTI